MTNIIRSYFYIFEILINTYYAITYFKLENVYLKFYILTNKNGYYHKILSTYTINIIRY